MTEIEWLDKVKKNFEYVEENVYGFGDAVHTINSIFRETYANVDFTGTLAAQNPFMNTVLVDNNYAQQGIHYPQPIEWQGTQVDAAAGTLNFETIQNAVNAAAGTGWEAGGINDNVTATLAQGEEYFMTADGMWNRRVR